MPSDNVVLLPGSGGATMRTLADSSSNEWPASVVAYATTLAPGANVLQFVTTTSGLPVSQQGTWTVAVSGTVPVSGTFWQTTQPVSGTFWQTTQPVSAASLPLPTGAALESGGNLATIVTNTGHIPALGQALAAASVPVVLTAAQLTTLTPLSSVSITGTPTVSGTVTANAGTNLNTSLLALETGGNLATLVTRTPALGQALAAASVPVILPSATITTLTPPTSVTVTQATAASLNATVTGTVTANAGTGTFAVSAASLPLPTGAAADTSVNGILVSQGSTTSGEKGPLMQAAVTTSAPSYTTAQTSPLSLDTSGNLRVNVVAGGTSGVVAQGSTTSGQSGMMVQGSVTTAAPTYTTAQTSPLSLTTSGAVRMDVTSVGGVATAQASFGSTLPATGTPCGAKNASGNLTSLALDASGNNLLVSSAPVVAACLTAVGAAITPQYAFVNVTSSGQTNIVATSAGKKVYVLRWSASSNGNVNISFCNHTAGTAISALHYMTQYASAGGAFCPAGIFSTASGDGLDLLMSATGNVGVEVTYVQY